MIFAIILAIIWCILLISLIGIIVALHCLKSVFMMNTEVDKQLTKKQFDQTVLTGPRSQYPMVARFSAYSVVLMLVVGGIGIVLMAMQKYLIAFFVFAIAPIFFLGLDVIYAICQYHYWQSHLNPIMILTTYKKFRIIISLRISRIILLTLLFLIPPIVYLVMSKY
ncbi:hypothetical protein [Lactiplantibacillus herbarum]|uniref:hypothetical protein n=1 Tax=Lactiplantibacillus herbarum TaxID=1670446 RepID=UPI00064FD5E0|nr:hypothetical protein [Lactiplantibacillus herbarum]